MFLDCMCWAAAVAVEALVPMPGESKSGCRGSAPSSVMNYNWPVATGVEFDWERRIHCGLAGRVWWYWEPVPV